MRLRRYLSFALVFVASFSFGIHANGTSIHIKGNFNNPDLNGKIVKLEYYAVYSQTGAWRSSMTTEIKITNKKFDSKLSGIEKIGYLKIILPDPKFSLFSSTPFLIESEDRLEFTQIGDSIKFNGEKSVKYSCQLALSNILPPAVSSSSLVADSLYFATWYDGYNKTSKLKLDKLYEYKSTISPDFYAVLKANINFGLDNVMYSLLRYTRRNDSVAHIIAPAFFKYYLTSKQSEIVDSTTLLNSYSYLDCQLEKQLCLLEMPEKGNERAKYRSVFEAIESNYQGAIRDRILFASLFSTFMLDNSMDFYAKKILSGVTDSVTIYALQDYLKTYGKGADFAAFHLKDTAKKIISLSDFKGKSLVIDYYFTGCVGCAKLTKVMAPIVEQYKDSSSVVFLSICLDEDFNMFKRAVKSRLYTHDGEINLYTNGEGMRHVLAKLYVPNGAPVLMLIDKRGKIFNGALPMPFDAANKESIKDYIDRSIKDDSY